MPDYPRLTDEQAKAVVAAKPNPKVTEDSIKAKIAHIEYIPIENTGTLCVITLKNGWLSTGFSAPADPRNFDTKVGERYAFDHAFKPLWQLEGYLLREILSGQNNTAEVRPFQDVAIVPTEKPE